MQGDTNMRAYYSERAAYYDRVYAIPERQSDLRLLESRVVETFRSSNLLEIACGTGYWTRLISPVANHITATDISSEVIEIARQRENCESVNFRIEDAFSMNLNPGYFDSLFSGLWISHITCQALRGFIEHAHQFLAPGSKVVFIDNSRRQCEELPIVHTDGAGNTYQDRELDDGSRHRILKNFPDASALESAIEGIGVNPQFEELDHYWWFTYCVK
jgi:demethylmenaquinone methyltransferase/2-methoxy-6-polyprenyl-1,4-benzoquinol methylase